MNFSGANNSKITTSTLSKSNRSTIKKKDNFFIHSSKLIWSFIMGFWMRLRKFAWIGSTGKFQTILLGFIIMVVPFVFAYMQEMQN